MRLALGHIDEFDDLTATFALQLGLGSVQFHDPRNLPSPDGFWTERDVAALVESAAGFGLRVEGLENVPARHFWKVQQGAPGRDEQLEKYLETIKSVGRAGVPTLGYNFTATYVWRTRSGALGRGGALVTEFDASHAQTNVLAGYKLAPPEVREDLDAEAMWANHQYFLDAAIPVAEEYGVRLCLHPDDPPVDHPLGGAARIFVTPASLVAAYDSSGRSSAWGLTFCMGTVSEMGGQAAVDSVIDSLGPQNAIAYIHLRDVSGQVPIFAETFLGAGNLDISYTLRKLQDLDFDGYIIDDHVPGLVGDKGTWEDVSSEAYCSRGRAHAIGYLQGILDAL